jgi:hypothetical protein
MADANQQRIQLAVIPMPDENLGESAWRDWRAFCRGMVWSAVIELGLALVVWVMCEVVRRG